VAIEGLKALLRLKVLLNSELYSARETTDVPRARSGCDPLLGKRFGLHLCKTAALWKTFIMTLHPLVEKQIRDRPLNPSRMEKLMKV